MNDEDDNGRLGMWIALGVALLVTIGTVLTLAWRSTHHKAPAAKAAPAAIATAAPAATADALLDIPLAGELAGKVFFDIGKADIGAAGVEAIGKALALVNASPTRKVVLSGFHDLSGDPVKNAELAKDRAKAVCEALKAQGLAADRVMLRKPAETGAGGAPEEARRVEIRLVD